jgi:squalene-hopene/tetraprenyl-beta-curcumene cyclase
VPRSAQDRAPRGIELHLRTNVLMPDRLEEQGKPAAATGAVPDLDVDSARTRAESDPWLAHIERAIARAQAALLQKRDPAHGYWCADLLSNTNLEANAIVLYHVLGRGGSSNVARLARHILSEQLPQGGWSEYRFGPPALTPTVRAYWALKLAGYRADDPRLLRARAEIGRLGGITNINSYASFNLALFGQLSWRDLPALLPELMLLPRWMPFNIYSMAGWTRAVIVPMTIAWALRPKFACPPGGDVDELLDDARAGAPTAARTRATSLKTRAIRWAMLMLRRSANLVPAFIRRRAIARAEAWMLEHTQDSDGLGAIMVAMMAAIVAMKALGYSDYDSRLRRQIASFEALQIDCGDTLRMQLCVSPVWDTAIAVIGLVESGVADDDPAIVQAAEWLMTREVRRPGDWRVANPEGPVSGWAFEFENAFYPDVDDTAMVLLALRRADLPARAAVECARACARGTEWLLSMQSDNGGWGAYDKNNTNALLNRLSFADHKAMIDPPSADITGRVLELLGHMGLRLTDARIAAAVSFLRTEQRSDGSWLGRWGVNYVYGTWQVLRGLAAVGADMSQPLVANAVNWLRSVQHPDGGWGETCASYADETTKGQGPSTPSQTSWALMALMAAGDMDGPCVRRGIAYLVETQNAHGGWFEDVETGTAIPGLLYFSYTSYRDSFPLWALGRYRRALRGQQQPPRFA